jgi:2,4-dienoyl-CoA reductase-like NADH-dependent reductase (Old Yellow Enzyme family)
MNQARDAFAPAQLGPVRLRNRIIKAATFEGVTRDHVPSERLIEFHRRAAAGGVALTTVAFCAVSANGIGTPNEIILSDAAIPGLQRLAGAVHAEGGAVSRRSATRARWRPRPGSRRCRRRRSGARWRFAGRAP